MNPSSNAVMSNLNGETNALGPRVLADEGISSEGVYRLHILHPEVERQFDIERHALDDWMTFRIMPELVERIYKGSSLDVDSHAITTNIIMPELTSQEASHLQLADAINARIPSIEESRGRSAALLEKAQADVAYARDEAKKVHGNLRIIMNLEEYKAEAFKYAGNVANRDTDIKNHTIRADAHTGMVTFIRNWQNADPEDIEAKTQSLIETAKPHAIQEVIDILKAQLKKLPAQGTDEDFDRLRDEFSHKITLLKTELDAMQKVKYEDLPVTEPIETVESATEYVETLQSEPATPEQKRTGVPSFSVIVGMARRVLSRV